jgi:hypothetical protein
MSCQGLDMSKRQRDYQPNPLFTSAFPEISGNTVNGLGETEVRRPSPYWRAKRAEKALATVPEAFSE